MPDMSRHAVFDALLLQSPPGELKILANLDPACPLTDAPDVRWWREGASLCLTSTDPAQPGVLTLDGLDDTRWAQVVQGHAQWWECDGDGQVRAAFALAAA